MEKIFEELRTWLGDREVLTSEVKGHLESQGLEDDVIRDVINSLHEHKFSRMINGEHDTVRYKGDTVEKLPPDMNPNKRPITVTHMKRSKPVIKRPTPKKK